MSLIVLVVICCFLASVSCQGVYYPANYNYSYFVPNLPNYPVINPPHIPVVVNPPPPGFVPGIYYQNLTNNNNNWNNNNNNWHNSKNNSLSLPCITPKKDWSGKQRNVFMGCVTTRDRMLYANKYTKPGRWWRNREKIVTYPDYKKRNETITGIWIYDKDYTGEAGDRGVSVTAGGVGQRFVTLRFYTDTRGTSFNYLLQIYGH